MLILRRVLLLSLLAAGCGAPALPSPDAGSTPEADAGTPTQDDGGSTSSPDGGHAIVDAGHIDPDPVDCSPRTFVVSTPGFFFAIEGMEGQNPPLALCRGVTYQFDL